MLKHFDREEACAARTSEASSTRRDAVAAGGVPSRDIEW